MRRCKHCGAPVKVFVFALGERLMHVEPGASFPTEHKGTAWTYCRLTVAEVEKG